MKYLYIPMPIDSDGNGPASEEETVKVLHEVWDDCFAKVCECVDAEVAKLVAQALNFYEINR